MSATTQTLPETSELQGEEKTEGLSKDKIFHILQTQRRRYALRYLKEHRDEVKMRDLAEQVAAWENDTTVQALASKERQRVYIALYQSHLPKLDEEGIINYNQSRGSVERGPLAEQFDPYFETTDTTTDETANSESPIDDDRWFSYYRWATVMSAGLFGAAWLNFPGISAISTYSLAAIVISLFAFISSAQFTFQ
ncbi:hypothetical protein ACFFQF_29645 [Haladaptatus pallidirubidus]|uniref:DUF7344 domain-containing protein n=1 Tax=Haladaptatus pallidirubidus TaxID=1008152 RepID=A0AAV3UHQ8_9EURY|nr:hypothetical protein [Haladaptatus pallidirubidus]